MFAESFDPRFTTDSMGNPIMRLEPALDVLANAPNYFVEAIRVIRKNGWVGRDSRQYLVCPNAKCISNAVGMAMSQTTARVSNTMLADQRAAVNAVLCHVSGVRSIGYLFVLNDSMDTQAGTKWAKRNLAAAHRLVVAAREE